MLLNHIQQKPNNSIPLLGRGHWFDSNCGDSPYSSEVEHVRKQKSGL